MAQEKRGARGRKSRGGTKTKKCKKFVKMYVYVGRRDVRDEKGKQEEAHQKVKRQEDHSAASW